MQYFELVNYAASHEDGRSERTALELGPSKRALCITDSGSRVLDLLVDDPAEVVALDFNPAQNALLELKMAAMRALDHEGYLAFLGLRPHPDRALLYRNVRAQLPLPLRRAWDRQDKSIRRGVIYSGRWERFLRIMVGPAAFARRDLVRRVFEAQTVEEQSELWLREWNTPAWDRYLGVLANRTIWTRIVREPGMSHIPADLDIVASIRGRFDAAAQRGLFRESPWAWLIFHGRLDASGPLPPHLQAAHFEALRTRTGRVRCVRASLVDFLQQAAPESFDAFSISDFGSYANDAQYAATWHAMARAAAPGAIVCERQFLVPRDPMALGDLGFSRDAELEQSLERLDNSVVYDLIAARKR